MAGESQGTHPDLLYETAEHQGGYFTAADALDAGYSYPLQHFHARKGNWRRVDRGIYRLRRFPNGPYEDLIRWWLWTRKKGAISHESAAAFYELGDLLPAHVHLSVPKTFRKPPHKGIRLHKSNLAADEVLEREGFLVTSPLRTILDLARVPLDHERLTHVVTDAIQKGLVTRRALATAVDQHPTEIDDSIREILHRCCGSE